MDSMDRFDVLAAVGVASMIVGAVLVHPALLLIAVGYLAVNVPRGAE